MSKNEKLAQDAKRARTLDVLWALDSSVDDFTGADAAEESDK
jgi:hypothetical protein